MRELIDMIAEAEQPEAVANPIKAKLQAELDKARDGDSSRFNVPGFRQKANGLNLADAHKGWATTWRSRALADLPDTVASVKKANFSVRTGKSAKLFTFVVFVDADGTELLAVQPRMSNNIYKYCKLEGGETLGEHLGPYWKPLKN